MGFLNSIFNKIKSATRERFILNKETNSIQILLDSSHEQYFTLTFDSINIRTPHDPNIFRSTVIDANNADLGELYIEVIELDQQHDWNGSAGSCFDTFIKQEFSSSKFEFIKSFDDDFTKFTKYLVDDKYEVGLIWFSLNKQDVFIFDTKGKLFNDLLKIYDVEQNSYFIENFETNNFVVKNSITKLNMIENFISHKE